MQIEALGRSWSWPDQDQKCHKVVFDWSKDLHVAYKHCRSFQVVLQAGGNMGVWPWLLAKRFEQVLTFEPDPVCLPHLVANLKGLKNVTLAPKALLDKAAKCEIKNDQPNNLGAQYVVPGHGKIEATTIDEAMRDRLACDLIYLDIEGAELAALKGGEETIRIHRPVVVVEDKGLSSRFGTAKGDVETWLKTNFGYVVAARPHRDVVLVCE